MADKIWDGGELEKGFLRQIYTVYGEIRVTKSKQSNQMSLRGHDLNVFASRMKIWNTSSILYGES